MKKLVLKFSYYRKILTVNRSFYLTKNRIHHLGNDKIALSPIQIEKKVLTAPIRGINA